MPASSTWSKDDRLVLAAASDPYADLVGEIALDQGEGLAWWAAEHKEPAWIRDELLADPRVKYVPELEEERFQSLVSVPIVGKDGDVIGVISSHTEAPREFTEAEVEVLVSSASLVAGAIENARLYEEMRRRVDELEHLTELGEILAGAEALDTVLPAVASRARKLLRAEACHLYLLDPASEVLHLRASAPEGAETRAEIGLAELGPELARSGRSASVAVPLVANDELLGLLAAAGTSEVDLARAVANQAAVALKKIELIERLTEKNLIKDFFEQLARGESLPGLEGRAARLGCDLDQRYVVLAASPPADELERGLAAAVPGSLLDRRDEETRALLRVPPNGEERLLASIRELQEGCRRRSRSGSRTSVAALRASRPASRRRATRSSARPSSRGLPASWRTRSSAPTSICCGCLSTVASATHTATPSHGSPSTTGSAPRRSCARSRSSCAAAARSARPPRRSTSTRTRCASACAGSASSRASTCARTTG